MFAVYAESFSFDDPLSGLVVGERPAPEAPDGWATVTVKAASLNHHDLWSLRGVGLRPDQLTVLDSAGLVNAKITPSGLLKALGLPATVIAGVGTPEELARLEQLTLADLLSASLDLLDQQKTLGLDVGALQEYIRLLLGVGPLDLPVKLLGDGGILDLIDGVDPLSALNVNLDVLQLVNTGLVVANGQNLIDLNLTALPSGLTNMFNNALDLRVRVVEPPSIAMGGIGTKANSAGVRVYLNLDTSKIPLAGPILKVLGTEVSLPVIIELSQATGELVNICRAPIAENQATIAVSSSLVKPHSFPALAKNVPTKLSGSP